MYPHYAHAFPLSKVETVTADLMFELLLHHTNMIHASRILTGMAMLSGGNVAQAKTALDKIPWLKPFNGTASVNYQYENIPYGKMGVALNKMLRNGKSAASYVIPNWDPNYTSRSKEIDDILRAAGFTNTLEGGQ